MPEELSSRGAGSADAGAAAAAVARAAMALLRRSLREPFRLTLLNIGATSFTDAIAPASAAALLRAGGGCFARSGDASGAAGGSNGNGSGAQPSKREARRLREHAAGAGGDDGGCGSDEDKDDGDDSGDAWALRPHGGGGSDSDGGGGVHDDAPMRWCEREGRSVERCNAAADAAPRPTPLPPQRQAPAAASGLRRFFGAAPSSPAAAGAGAADADAAAALVTCGICGRALPAAAAAEHADWHVARELQRADWEQSAAAAAGTGQPGRKRGPLDAFLRGHAPPPP
jgi:hypothetical protein